MCVSACSQSVPKKDTLKEKCTEFRCPAGLAGRTSTYTPYTQYPLFLGYDVDPLLKKEVFTMPGDSFSMNFLVVLGFDLLFVNLDVFFS